MNTVRIDLSNVDIIRYKDMYKWCLTCLSEQDYKWHHQPSQGRGKYWVDFLSNSSVTAFTIRWL